MVRKGFTTSIEESIQKRFKLACVRNDMPMNEVLENLMQRYIDGTLTIETTSENDNEQNT